MKIKKVLTVALALGLVGLLLTSCSSEGSETTTTPVATSTQTTTTAQYKEVADTDFKSGKYMHNASVYEFDKTNKKIIITDYKNYTAYKNNEGTKKLDTTVKFVESTFGNAVYFEYNSNQVLLYLRDGKPRKYTKTSGGYSDDGLVNVLSIIEPTYGTFVSAAETQKKVDSEGNYIMDGDNYVTETFYLFLELTETDAKVYVSDNNQTHGAAALHEVSNYELRIINGYVTISIPHKNGDYDVSLRFTSSTTIRYTNSYEKRGDYSCAGTLTKVN